MDMVIPIYSLHSLTTATVCAYKLSIEREHVMEICLHILLGDNIFH